MTYVFDLDGTLADASARLHLIDRTREGGPDWDGFFAACLEDRPIWPVIYVVKALLMDDHRIVYMTGRPERVRQQTAQWLLMHGLPDGPIMMRADGDHRPDTITKREHMARLIERDEEIAGVFEDRPAVVRLWRELGLTVFQVGSGEEF